MFALPHDQIAALLEEHVPGADRINLNPDDLRALMAKIPALALVSKTVSDADCDSIISLWLSLDDTE